MLYSQFGKQDKDATHCEALESGRMGREWLVMSGIGGGRRRRRMGIELKQRYIFILYFHFSPGFAAKFVQAINRFAAVFLGFHHMDLQNIFFSIC